MKKDDMLTAVAYMFSALVFILFAFSEYENSPIPCILLIIIQSYFFLYYTDILIKRIKEKKALSQTAEAVPDVKEELDNWTITSFFVISLAFIILFIIEYRDMPVFRISIIIVETVILLICTVERIKRVKAAKQEKENDK